MAHVPEHIEEIPETSPEQGRETLLETYKDNPLRGLAKTATMFMPDWVSGVPRNELSLGDTVKSMIEFTPVVGDVLDLKEGADFQNDLDPLERGLAIFAGLGAVGAGLHITRNSYTTMRQRYIQDIKSKVVSPVFVPDAAGGRPVIQMHTGQDFNSIRKKLQEEARKGSKKEIGRREARFNYSEKYGAPRHVQISVAENLVELFNAISSRSITDQNAFDASGFRTVKGIPSTDSSSRVDAAFVGFVYQLGVLMLNQQGLDTSTLGVFEDTLWDENTGESLLESEAGFFGARIPQNVLEAATEALAIFSQVMDAELIHDAVAGELGNRLFSIFPRAKGSIFSPPSTEGDPDTDWSYKEVAEMNELISLIGDVAEVVTRHSGPNLELAPNLKWNSFYRDDQGRMQGTLNIHIMPDSRYVDVENGQILDPEGLERALWRLDWDTVIPNMVLNLLSIHHGGTSVAVNDVHRAKAKEWYPQFNKLINVISERYGITPIQAGAIISALSPRAAWDPDNINWGILGAFEAVTGTTDEAAQLHELNHVRQLAGFAPVTKFKSFGQALQVGQSKVADIFDQKNPIEVLRMLKTMSFLHNGLYPEGTAADSPIGLQVITADTHHFRAVSGFFHPAEAPWMKQTKAVTGKEGFWESAIGADLVRRNKDLKTGDEILLPGVEVPHSVAERTYDAITRATVIAADILGIKPIEAQAMFWQPVQEAGVAGGGTLAGNKTVVWNDSLLKEIEGRSSTSPALTDTLPLLDDQLIDPMSSHLDIFTVSDVHNFEPDIGILVASSSNGVRIYADPETKGVSDQLRTARPINAKPVLLTGKKEGLDVSSTKATSTKQNPVRWVSRKSRKADLGVVSKAMIETAPASELRTVSDPSVMENIPDVHQAGNFIVVEVEQGNEAMVNRIINENPLPFTTSVQVPITVQKAGRSNQKISTTLLEAGLGSKPSNNPLITNNWVMVPKENGRLIGTLRRKGYSITPSYVRVGEEVQETWLIMGIDESTKGLDSFSKIWTQDAMFDNVAGTMAPATEGVTIGRGGGTEFSVLTEKGGEDFSVNYDEDLSIPAVQENVTRTDQELKSSKRTQIIVSLGSTPDPGMVNALWKKFDADGSVVSLSGYFHGELWTDSSMSKVGEYSYTNGQERMTQRALHNGTGLTDENYYDVWVPTTEAVHLSETHGAFATKGHFKAKVKRVSDQMAVIDGETQIASIGSKVLEVNANNIFQSTIDGEQIEELAVITQPTGERLIVVGLEGEVQARVANAPIQPPAIFSLTATGKIKKIFNDSLGLEEGVNWNPTRTTADPEGKAFESSLFMETPPWAQGLAFQQGEMATGEAGTVKGWWEGRRRLPSVSSYEMGIYNPAYVAEINDLFNTIELLVRYGANGVRVKNLLKNHPLGAALDSRWSVTGYMTGRQRAATDDVGAEQISDFETRINNEYTKLVEEKEAYTYEEDQTPISSENEAFLDAYGEIDVLEPDGTTEVIKAKKAAELDWTKQKEFKQLAKDFIGDYSIFDEGDDFDSIPLLAGYEYPNLLFRDHNGKLVESERLNKSRDAVVTAVIKALGALTERPGFTSKAENGLRDLPGIKKLREKHGGIVFPGVALLLGSVTVGAMNSAFQAGGRPMWGGLYHSTYLTGNRPDTPSRLDTGPVYDLGHNGSSGPSWALDEDGNAVFKQGIHLGVQKIIEAGDMERYVKYAKFSLHRDGNKWKHLVNRFKNQKDAAMAATMIHEFGHGTHGVIAELGRGHSLRAGMDRIVQSYGGIGVVYREIGRYAASSWRELFAESFQEYMILGDDAHPMTQDIVELAWQLLYNKDVTPIRKELESLSIKESTRNMSLAEYNAEGKIRGYKEPYGWGMPTDLVPFWQWGISGSGDWGKQPPIGSASQRGDKGWVTVFHYLQEIKNSGGTTGTNHFSPVKRLKTKRGEVNLSMEDWSALG